MLASTSDPAEIVVCKRLWASVFRLGVEDAIVDKFSGRYWLDNTDHRPGSFSWLCELFGHNPTYIRIKVKAQYK
jgi:hypothetical protein